MADVNFSGLKGEYTLAVHYLFSIDKIYAEYYIWAHYKHRNWTSDSKSDSGIFLVCFDYLLLIIATKTEEKILKN